MRLVETLLGELGDWTSPGCERLGDGPLVQAG